jgi:hypothetical protein
MSSKDDKKSPRNAAARRALEKAKKKQRNEEAAVSRQDSLKVKLIEELSEELGPAFVGSLEQHRDRWLDGMGEFPLSPFTLKAIRGETPTLSEALDCACGVVWWCQLRLAQEGRQGQAQRAEGAQSLLSSRVRLFTEGPAACPAGVDPALWTQLLSSVLEYARNRGWLEASAELPGCTADWDVTNLPEPLDLEGIVEGDPGLRALRAASPKAFARGLQALSRRVLEAESISSSLADRSSDSFLARLDATKLRRLGLLDSGGRRNVLARHLALWILDAAGVGSHAQGLFLLHAGLLEFEHYTPARPQTMASVFTERAKHAKRFWSDRATRTEPATPVGLIGDLEWSAGVEHHGLARARQMALNTLEEQERFGQAGAIR